MMCPLKNQQIGFSGGTGTGATDISQKDDDFVDTTAKLDAARLEESVAMARSQQTRGMIDHETGTAANINAKIIKESVSMAHSQLEMGLINHATGYVNAIFGGNGGLRCGS